MQLLIERLFRLAPAGEAARWKQWRRAAAAVVDPTWQSGDPGPAVADVLGQIWAAIRHPRSFLRSNTRRPI